MAIDTGITLAPFFNIEPQVQIHIVAALVSIALTPFTLWRERRDRLHKTLGYIWVTAMAVLSISSFWISNIGGVGYFSPLHLLAVLTLVTLFLTIRFAIKGNIEAHKRGLQNLATFGLGLPMVLNFLPGRTFSRAFSAEDPMRGLITMAVFLAIVILWRRMRPWAQPAIA